MEFWEEVGLVVQEILSIQIAVEPKFFVLGIYPEEHNIKRGEQIFVDVPFTSQEIDSINMEK